MIQPSPYSATRRKVASTEPPMISCGGSAETSGPIPSLAGEPEESEDPAQTCLIRSSICSNRSPREPKSAPDAT